MKIALALGGVAALGALLVIVARNVAPASSAPVTGGLLYQPAFSVNGSGGYVPPQGFD